MRLYLVTQNMILQHNGYYQTNPKGRLLYTTINDGEPTRIALSEYLADLFQKGFTLLVFLAVIVVLNWKMALGTAILVPLVVVPVGKLGKKIRRSSENSQSRLGDLSQILQETVSGNRVVKAFGMADFAIC